MQASVLEKPSGMTLKEIAQAEKQKKASTPEAPPSATQQRKQEPDALAYYIAKSTGKPLCFRLHSGRAILGTVMTFGLFTLIIREEGGEETLIYKNGIEHVSLGNPFLAKK